MKSTDVLESNIIQFPQKKKTVKTDELTGLPISSEEFGEDYIVVDDYGKAYGRDDTKEGAERKRKKLQLKHGTPLRVQRMGDL